VNNSLNGAHILVTRPRDQSEALCRLIEQSGGLPLRFPTLEIQALPMSTTATFSLEILSNRQIVIFTSANAVNFAMAAIDGKIRVFAKASIAAIGKATASVLNKAGIPVDVLPEKGHNSEALLSSPQLSDVCGKTIVIVKGQGGREELSSVLAQRGAIVHNWEVYRRVIPSVYDYGILQAFIHGKTSVITATSCETLENLLSMSVEAVKERLVDIPLVVISQRIADLAGQMGFNRIAVTDDPSDQAILDTTIAIINEGRCG
jgi:uroporphyrinogen-III synthase